MRDFALFSKILCIRLLSLNSGGSGSGTGAGGSGNFTAAETHYYKKEGAMFESECVHKLLLCITCDMRMKLNVLDMVTMVSGLVTSHKAYP
jgi:hypothetical protein